MLQQISQAPVAIWDARHLLQQIRKVSLAGASQVPVVIRKVRHLLQQINQVPVAVRNARRRISIAVEVEDGRMKAEWIHQLSRRRV